MENYNLHRRAQSGWHPTSYSRKPTPDAPRERNYEAILAAAKRPPVGYYEDAPKGMKFSGEASARSPEASEVGGLSKTPTHATASVSSDDLYEPIGTMPAARAWKSWCGYHWLLIGVKWFAASPTTGWTQFPDNWLAGSAMAGWVEQSPAEVQCLVDECMAAMKGKS